MKQALATLFTKSKLILVVVVLFTLGLLTGLFLSFPELKVKQKIISTIEAHTQVLIDQGDINFGFLSLTASDLLIQSPNHQWPPIPINTLHLAPKWLTLLSKNPGALLDMQLLDGTLQADMFRDGTFKLTAAQLNLAPLSPKEQNITLSGQLAEMTLTSTVPLMKTSESLIAFKLKNINVSRNNDLKLALNLGDIVINASGRGRSFKIISLTTERGDLSISGQGSVLLGKDMPSTRVKMKLEIRPEETVDPMVVELLQLGARQTANGSYELNLSGSLSAL